MRKKLLSLALALAMCLGLTVPAFAANEDFTIQDGVLTAYNGSGGDVVIPDNVTSIGTNAFRKCRSLTSVTIPSSVTEIGQWAFNDCTSLTSVTMSPGVTKIGGGAFLNCFGLTNVTIPSSVTVLEDGAFAGCTSLTSVTIPSGVTVIGIETFGGCTNLTSVSIPSSVTVIGVGAFNICTSLKDVYFAGTEAQWKAITIEYGNEPFLAATVHYNSTGSGATTQPQQPTGKTAAASPTNDKLEVNGAAANPTVYKIDGSNYFKIRDVAALLNGTEKQFAVGYDGQLKSVTATTGQGYDKQSGDLTGAPSGEDKTAEISDDTIYVNGRKVEAQVYKIDGSNYFKLRDLGKALDFYVGWEAGRGMYIETDKPYS